MTAMQCTYSGHRDETIVAYLYDDITPFERVAFERHLDGCPTCRDELAELREVRAEMGQWSPPMLSHQSSIVRRQEIASDGRQSRDGFWTGMPVWMQTAAALLVVGVSAGAANLNVHHDATGFTVRTGWMPSATAAASKEPADQTPWRADLAKLESEIQASAASRAHVVETAALLPRASGGDEETLRKVKALLADSEKKEENELALRIAQLARERQAERLSDLTRIEGFFGAMQASTTNTGFKVQRLEENQNTLLQRVSLSQNAR